jgi:hypothetical protein
MVVRFRILSNESGARGKAELELFLGGRYEAADSFDGCARHHFAKF